MEYPKKIQFERIIFFYSKKPDPPKIVWVASRKNINSRVQQLPQVLRQEHLSRGDILKLLSIAKEEEYALLFEAADVLTRKIFANGVYLRGIIEISNICRRNCDYCGIRKANMNLVRYRMQPEEILEAAGKIRDAGIMTVVLQSGEDPYYSKEMIAELIRSIKKEYRLAITLSLGEYPFEIYKYWREAGADRYLLKFESSSRKLYQGLHPDCDYDERWRCLRDIRLAGYQLGSGFMIGLPGQSQEMLADDLLALADLKPDMAGIGPFIAHPQTPLAPENNGDTLLALKVLAIARLLLKDTHLPTTTALETLENDSRVRGLRAGANVIMPNFTPEKYKKYYEIYPNKAGSNSSPESSMRRILEQIRNAGKYVESGYGHTLKKEEF